MATGWHEPHPTPDFPVTSAWGRMIESYATPIFDSLSALNTGWATAPEGAHAFTLLERRTYAFRGGAWRLPLEGTQGLKVSLPGPWATDVNGINAPADNQGAGVNPGGVGPTIMKGRRTYLVSVRGRFSMAAALTNRILSVVVNATGTGADVPLTTFTGNAPEFANGQRPIDAAVLMSFQGAVIKQSWTGLLVTGGADDQDLAVRWALVIATAGTPIAVVETGLIAVDVGPA